VISIIWAIELYHRSACFFKAYIGFFSIFSKGWLYIYFSNWHKNRNSISVPDNPGLPGNFLNFQKLSVSEKTDLNFQETSVL
jgi:hypothetical protein